MKARILTEEQKYYTVNYDCLFNPILHNNTWIVLIPNDYEYVSYEWLKECPEIEIEL